MTISSLASLLVSRTKEFLYDRGLEIATSLGLPVTSWSAGDPTRSLYHFVSEIVADALEPMAQEFVKSGFLDHAEGDWLNLRVEQSYGVTPIEATHASCTLRLTNTGGGLYEIRAGELTAKNSVTDKTYHSTNAIVATLAPGPGTFVDITIEADEPGSDSNAAIGEIDELVTTLLGVTCTNTTTAVGLDEEEPVAKRNRARAKLGALSPNGPRDAYQYIATTPELAGTSAVTRVRTLPNNGTGQVLVFLGGPAGPILNPADVELVGERLLGATLEDGSQVGAAPLCVTPIVASASALIFPIEYTIYLYASVSKTAAEVEEEIEDALGEFFASRPIGGDIIVGATGRLYYSSVLATIRNVYPDHCFRVILANPVSDVDLGISQVPTLGTITPTVVFVQDPQ